MRLRPSFVGPVFSLFFAFAPAVSSQEAPRRPPVVGELKRFLAEELQAKGIPALSIALVDDQTTVWQEGFGWEDPDRKTRADARTVYRVGSVSKPITALLLMMLVEKGLLDLDVPVRKYLPDFRPKNETGKAITLRQILCHKSGLVRESPVGSYFDATEPTLAQTVASLNGLPLVYPPETKTSYSNAALAVVGLVLQEVGKRPFEEMIKSDLLLPLGMKHSAYDRRDPAVKDRIARSIMWTYHGRTFPAPTFDLGMPSAGSLYSSVEDQATLLKFLLAGGVAADGKRLLKNETLQRMFEVQIPDKGQRAGFGIGWFVSELDGTPRMGHGGAVYGCATEIAFLPREKLGVIVTCSCDVANGVTRRVADQALRMLRASKTGKKLPRFDKTRPLTREQARSLAGRYRSGKKGFDVLASGERSFLLPLSGGIRQELRLLGDDLIVDDRLTYGPRLRRDGERLVIGKDVYVRQAPSVPAPCPKKYLDYLGEFGPDHNILVLLERDGELNALIEWVFLYPLKEIAPDTYRFPDFGLYHSDKLVFHRNAAGKVDRVVAANVRFDRRPSLIAGETFRITPRRPLADIAKEARQAMPPLEKNAFLLKPDLLDLKQAVPGVHLDIRYAGKNNFLGSPVYPVARALMQRPAAQALARVQATLRKDHALGLLVHDAYRPWHVTRIFWDATPDRMRHFVADPLQGSRHNRGCAVDLTLCDPKSGKAVDLVSGYDEFTDRAYPDYLGGTSRQRYHRDLLRRAMEGEGFTVYEAEWWHYDHRDWRRYPILNLPLEN